MTGESGGGGTRRAGDASTRRLAALFAHHPAWIRAAGALDPAATSNVYFAHRPGEQWHLATRDGVARLGRGAVRDPDLVFRFSPAAIDRLEGVEGEIGDFAVALFEQILGGEVDLRVRAPFTRLAKRGYVKLLLLGGAPVLAFGARQGVRTLGGLRRMVAELRESRPADWEREGPPEEPGS